MLYEDNVTVMIIHAQFHLQVKQCNEKAFNHLERDLLICVGKCDTGWTNGLTFQVRENPEIKVNEKLRPEQKYHKETQKHVPTNCDRKEEKTHCILW